MLGSHFRTAAALHSHVTQKPIVCCASLEHGRPLRGRDTRPVRKGLCTALQVLVGEATTLDSDLDFAVTTSQGRGDTVCCGVQGVVERSANLGRVATAEYEPLASRCTLGEAELVNA